MTVQDLTDLAMVPGFELLVEALANFYASVENIKVCKDQCTTLRNQCTHLLLSLRDNADNLGEPNYHKVIHEAEFHITRTSRIVHTWSTWGRTKAIIHQFEIRQGLEALFSDLTRYSTYFFNTLSDMEITRRQRDHGKAVGSNKADVTGNFRSLLDNTDLYEIAMLPERDVMVHMLRIQEAIHAAVAESEMSRRLQERLLEMHRVTELLPPMVDLTGEVRYLEKSAEHPSDRRGDVYLGVWLGEEMVALKRLARSSRPRVHQRLMKKVTIWRQLLHKHVVRLYGLATIDDYVYMVSPWMDRRNVLSYIESNSNVDRLKLLHEVAIGLEFLHSHGVIHGDLRGSKILVPEFELTCITDYGILMIIEEEVLEDDIDDSSSFSTKSSLTIDNPGSIRWMAPELVNPQLIGLHEVRPSTATDIWSFGMLCLEVLTGHAPFHHRIRMADIMSDLADGVRPMRPSPYATPWAPSDLLWELMQHCWHTTPRSRPPMVEIVRRLGKVRAEQISPPGTPSSPNQYVHDTNDATRIVSPKGIYSPEYTTSQSSSSSESPVRSNSPTTVTLRNQIEELTVDINLHPPHGDGSSRSDSISTDINVRRGLDANYEDAFNKTNSECLDGQIIRLSNHVVAFGGFADVWEGFYGEQKVAIKTIRLFSASGKRIPETKLRKRLKREYLAWACLSHPNVLECLGFSYDFSPSYVFPSLISPWMTNGSVFPYLEQYPETIRTELLLGVAQGLAYLHNRKPCIIHGDLRAGNILMSDSGVPCLSDFGLSRVLQIEEMTSTSELAGSLRWMSPELLIDYVVANSSSDVWAYGMTVLEILSGNHPYYECKKEAVVLGQLKDGQIPLRPQSSPHTVLTDKVWAVCLRCWSLQASERPTMDELIFDIKSMLPAPI